MNSNCPTISVGRSRRPACVRTLWSNRSKAHLTSPALCRSCGAALRGRLSSSPYQTAAQWCICRVIRVSIAGRARALCDQRTSSLSLPGPESRSGRPAWNCARCRLNTSGAKSLRREARRLTSA